MHTQRDLFPKPKEMETGENDHPRGSSSSGKDRDDDVSRSDDEFRDEGYD